MWPKTFERRGEVVAVLGCEMSMFGSGFVPGDGVTGRMATMTDPATWTDADAMERMAQGFARAQAVQRSIVERARRAFGGRVTYAAGMWEEVDWDLFDIVSVDGYRDAANAAGYREQLRRYASLGRPLAITEFGCCTYAGASERGGDGWLIVDRRRRSARPRRTPIERDEGEQVRYFRDLMASVRRGAGRHRVLVHRSPAFALPHRPDASELDLDVASYGAVAVCDATTGPDWEPKQVFAGDR